MSKINSLTAEQEADLLAYREECLRIGRSTEPADRSAAEGAITEMYRLLGEQPPHFWWCDGPAVGSFVRTILKNDNLSANFRDNLWVNLSANLSDNLSDNLRANLRDNLNDNLSASLSDSLNDNLRDNLWDNLSDNLNDNLRADLSASLRANLSDNLSDNLRASLADNLRANLRANLSDNLRDNLWDNLRANLRRDLSSNLWWYNWGQHEIYWQAFYDWPDRVLKKMYSEENRQKLDLWLTISRSCSWWQPFKNTVFVCERPLKLIVDAEDMLHSINTPALLCRDGWPVYAIHGVRVPEYVIERPEEITVPKIDQEANTETRRVMIERYGQERFLRDAGAILLWHDEWGKLWKRNFSDDEPIVMIEVLNSTMEPDGTFKTYFLRVPPETKNVREGIAWTFGKSEKQYAPIIQS